jgi:hypothetical protein
MEKSVRILILVIESSTLTILLVQLDDLLAILASADHVEVELVP